MSGPGKGRYTTYVDTASSRNSLLWKLFNKKAPSERGVFYGGQEPSDNAKAAAAAVERATAPVKEGVGGLIPSQGLQAADPGMFPNGVDLSFGNAPNLTEVAWKRPGDPANPFVPDLSSPGPERTAGTDKDVNPNIGVGDIKPAYDTKNPPAVGEGTVSPSSTSTAIGASPIGKDLTRGKSSV